MPNLKVTLYIRITTPDGKRKMCKPIFASRRRLKPLCAEGFGHQPDGEYYLRYAGKWECAGNDAYVALDRLADKQRELRCTENVVPNSSPGAVTRPSAVRMTLDPAVREHLTTGKAAEKDWRKHTLQYYTLSLKLFRESCAKAYLDEIDDDDLRFFKFFLRKQQTQTKAVKNASPPRPISTQTCKAMQNGHEYLAKSGQFREQS